MRIKRGLVGPVVSLALALPSGSRAGPVPIADLAVSSRPVASSPSPIAFKFGFEKGAGHARSSIGAGAGIKEGKPLEMALWGAGGAVAGSLAGPVGAAIGSAAGALIGLLVATFATPRKT